MPEFKMPKWEKVAYAFDTKGTKMPKLPFSMALLLAIAWIKQMYHRVKGLKKTLIIHIDGDHRSWKSVWGCVFGALLDKTFIDNFDNRVIHSQKGLIDEISRIDKARIFGACIIVDEAGSTVNKQKYYEEMAQVINENVQILGYLKTIIIFISPRREFILSSLRKMTHKHFYMERDSNEYSYLTPYDIRYNSYKEESYKRKPRIRFFGQKIVLTRIKVHSAPKWLVEKYEALENLRKPALLAKMQEKSAAQEIANEREDIDKLIERVVANPDDYASKRSTPGNIILEVWKLKNKLHVSKSEANEIKAMAEEKLYKITAPIRQEEHEREKREAEARKKEKEAKKDG